MFLLALCCQDSRPAKPVSRDEDPDKCSTTPVTRDEDLEKRFNDCHRSVIPIANDKELQNELQN